VNVKSRKIALILWGTLGWTGAHRLYLGGSAAGFGTVLMVFGTASPVLAAKLWTTGTTSEFTPVGFAGVWFLLWLFDFYWAFFRGRNGDGPKNTSLITKHNLAAERYVRERVRQTPVFSLLLFLSLFSSFE
jgi:hypothetical protein